jgi:hypothetical protein
MFDTRYMFTRSAPGIWTELYFPKKAAYQGAIFDALRSGFDPERVRTYLKQHAAELIEEFQTDWPEILDPGRYTRTDPRTTIPVLEREAIQRILAYSSVFFGYSMYSVDGVFFNPETGREDEEATQVVRIVFKFVSGIVKPSPEERSMYLAMAKWLIDHDVRSEDRVPWDAAELDRFLAEYTGWSSESVHFAKNHYVTLAKEVDKWIADCGLFLFGYFVRQFSARVLAEQKHEDEIWVVSFFNPSINIVERFSRDHATRRKMQGV